jgi:hypothetical protein
LCQGNPRFLSARYAASSATPTSVPATGTNSANALRSRIDRANLPGPTKPRPHRNSHPRQFAPSSASSAFGLLSTFSQLQVKALPPSPKLFSPCLRASASRSIPQTQRALRTVTETYQKYLLPLPSHNQTQFQTPASLYAISQSEGPHASYQETRLRKSTRRQPRQRRSIHRTSLP